VTGTTTATPASPAGTYPIVPTATGTNLADYTVTYDNGTLTINKATPILNWPPLSPIVYGTALGSTQLDATSSIPDGTFAYTYDGGTANAAGAILTAGAHTLTVVFTPTDTNDYTTQTASVSLVVIAATPVINWSNPASITYGTPISTTQLDATASTPNGGAAVTGTFTYIPVVGTILSVGTQPLSVAFVPTDTNDFTNASKTVTINILAADLIVTANDATKIYGTANPTFTGSITGTQNNDVFTESFSSTAGALSNVGTYAIVPSVTGTNIGDYIQTINNGTLTITKSSVISTLTLSTTNVPFEIPVTMTVMLQSATSGTPTGTVSFFDNGNLIGTSPISGNAAVFTTATLPIGVNNISTLYSGDQNFYAQTAGASTTSTGIVQVTPLDFSIAPTSATTLYGVYGNTGTFTFHLAPIGGSYPGDVTITVNGKNGPIFATYTFTKNAIGMYDGAADITLTVGTHKLAKLDRPSMPSSPFAPVALGLFLIPLASAKRLRKSSRKLARAISMSLLLLLALGGIASLTGCGTGYPSVDDPIIITATSNGVSHSITVNFHMDKEKQ
jgi:hypothetical protein